MRVHVMGLGAVGCLVAFHLRRALDRSSSVTLMHKHMQHLLKAHKAGSTVKVEHSGTVMPAYGFEHDVWEASAIPQRDTQVEEIDIPNREVPKPPSASGSGAISTLFVTTKAYSILPSIKRLIPRLTADSTIVLMNNGMGVYEQLVTQVFPNRLNRPHFIVAVNSHGAWLKQYLHIVHAGIGNIKFAIMPDGRGRDFEAAYRNAEDDANAKLSLDDIHQLQGDPADFHYYSLRRTVQLLQDAKGLYAHWLPVYNVQQEMRRKVVVNSVINPLTALIGCQNGEIFEHEAGKPLAIRICAEAAAAFRAEWETSRRRGINAGNQSLIDEKYPSNMTSAAFMQECERIARITSDNISSMLTDVRRARPTEIDYLNGYLFNVGVRHRVPMPTNRTMIQLMALRSSVPLRGLL
ncbi:ketopantoate reductase-like protein [Panus rudis PR-1116 ss-1]|nr:ketopantoate reductase-like protein [Panus rudis PR-1116 ss-1]